MTVSKARATADYLCKFAAQTPALGRRGQLRLRKAHVAIIGAGGVGSAACLALASVGVGRITAIDPQVVEPDNFNRFAFVSDSDVGVGKVSTLDRVLKGRPHLAYEGIEATCFDDMACKRLTSADILVSTSNSLQSRRFMARFALQHRIPHVFAGAEDGRMAFGGTVGVWVPERGDLACQSCYLPSSKAKSLIEASLVATAVAVVGGLAAHLVVRLLTEPKRAVVAAGNLMSIRLDSWQLEAVVVRGRSSCCHRRARQRHRP